MVLDAARNTERGSVLIMLFIAVALFGLLAFAFLQGSRNNLSMMTSEAQKAQATQVQDCTNGVDMAERRLQAKGCGALVSHNTDGSNTNPGAPSDGSCSIYHSNGGGMKPCAAPPCDLTTLAIGDECGGYVYAGNVGGRFYTARTDHGAANWNNGTATYVNTGATSTTGGVANTNTLVAFSGGGQPYQAAVFCRALGAQWYLPSEDEMAMMYANNVAIGAFPPGGTLGDWYWSSTQSSNNHAQAQRNDAAMSLGVFKNTALRVRCAYRP